MKIIKLIIDFFKSFFLTAKDFKKKVTKKVKRNQGSIRRTNREKRNDWLASKGYTPIVNSPLGKKTKETPISHYGATMIKAKQIGRDLRKNHFKIKVSQNKNKYGLNIKQYFGIDIAKESEKDILRIQKLKEERLNKNLKAVA